MMDLEPLVVLFLAVLLDLLIGDPRVAYHPVALIGRLISAWERLLYRCEPGGPPDAAAGAMDSGHGAGSAQPTAAVPGDRQAVTRSRRAGARWRGAVLVLGTVLPVWLLVYLCLACLGRLRADAGHPQLWTYIYLAVSILFLWSTMSIRSLHRAAGEILSLLRQSDLAGARHKLSHIVGRDTDRLDPAEITRATVETVAENISDGVIAPLFYFLLGGPALACAYRAINTLDSMVGYRSERYQDFGMVAARLDDVANFIPARLTVPLLVGSALLLGLDWRQAWRLAWRDGHKHPSPNSGYPEAAVAGALGVQLGGLNYYLGQPSLRSRLGDPKEILEPGHIEQTIGLLYVTAALFVVLSACGWLAWTALG